MAASYIDGTVEEVTLGRSRRGTTVFKVIRFTLADGSSRTIKKAVLKSSVAELVAPGAHGRFYLFNAFDIRGIHGVRLADGRAACEFPTTNQKLFMLVVVISVLWIGLKVTVDEQLPLLGVALVILGVVGSILMARAKAEAERQFASDTGSAELAAAPAR